MYSRTAIARASLVLVLSMALSASVPEPAHSSPAAVQGQCPICVNQHTLSSVTCACTVTIFYELHEGSICQGTPCMGGGCNSTVKFTLSGTPECTGNKTLQCGTECGGSCSATGRCRALAVTCTDCAS